MDYLQRWEIIEPLGEGGQGKVYRVRDKRSFDLERNIGPRVKRGIERLCVRTHRFDDVKQDFEMLRGAILDLIGAENASHHGALKVLHEPDRARNPATAESRIALEIKAMTQCEHPNLLRILDVDEQSKWFVSQYYPSGTLASHVGMFRGDFLKALLAFRPLVEAVAEVHKKRLVHRDIKPQNIFLDSEGRLILGDFGIVFFQDAGHTRISESFENVGSRDWMPFWATTMRIDKVGSQFDVHSLGKVLWSMVSGLPLLRGWYFNDPDYPMFNVEKLFPGSNAIMLANPFFQKCIVEKEKDCIADAGALLVEVDRTLCIIENNGELLADDVERRCKVCGIGHYGLVVNRVGTATRNFGFQPGGSRSFKIFTCDHCGHVQLFAFGGRQDPPAWASK